MSERLGPYELLSRLGAGGFGEVHLALDAEGRTVAVKVLHPHVAADSVALARLAREVETMRMVGGPHIAEVLDASLRGSRPYLVTRYVQGRPLSSVPLPVADLRRLASGLAEALVAMHEAGVVHRDLKPANVMMTEGEPVVIDFGIASALDSLSVTASGAVVGTPGYLAPEVLEGRAVGMEADVFAFGATLAYAATGRQPYGQGPASAVAYRVVHHPPDLEGVPEWLEPLLRECLATDPAARPTAAQICARLGVAPVPYVPPRPAPVPAPARHAADDDLSTREWQPGKERYRRSVEESRARHREKVRRRWLIGSGLFVSLLAAAAREPLPEVSLFLLAAYALGVVSDAGVALFSRSLFKRRRMVADVVSVVGAVGLCFGLAATFSPFTLALFAGTALVVGVVFLLSA
ncbi:serine/threonine-protein kinase [Nonomuraea gerenzanensis]|uniref:Putative serine/threonine protein kinase n=1 Tax=Nonomuraea gerenzanensis TaxID=93944 RepID=A0A1M4ENV9_9ACTN|nr:serine/threonine-protein kinase [Nonomuraea gerenzanensis]UBU11995.1 serine/threonine protein kinase [Nonomuraea gerenzanensis]SBP00510.1 putative serine/threonine protein kinase [Nonomuraea gerenzanensis]